MKKKSAKAKTKRPQRSARFRLSVSKPSPLITLTTDFGTADHYVSAMKGVILGINPCATIVDITHEIPNQDIAAGAFTMLAAYDSFPSNTVNVAVVDPGVGSSRRPIVISAAERFFVGPDNGIFSYIYERDPLHRTFHVTREEYFRKPVSATFHGRDVFAPVGAALSMSMDPGAFGAPISDEVRLPSLLPEEKKSGRLSGRIIHVDRFGNCITNFTRESIKGRSPVGLRVEKTTISDFRRFFGDDDGSDVRKPFAIWGSSGFLEIAVRDGSAAQVLRLTCGDEVVLSLE